MVAVLLILILLVLVFGGLAAFVARVFLIALLIALLVSALVGGSLFRRRD